jgi:hypothetical protein
MKPCTQCFYVKRTTLATWEPALTCLPPLSRTPVGYPIVCSTARQADGFCGIEGSGFIPATRNAQPMHFYRQ